MEHMGPDRIFEVRDPHDPHLPRDSIGTGEDWQFCEVEAMAKGISSVFAGRNVTYR